MLKAAKQKHRYIMYLIKKVGNHVKGMGLKLMKFHGIMHMYMDIIHFGIPMEFDTGYNESGHKPTKKAALLTQKREDTFDQQVEHRWQEVSMLDLAKLEIDGRPLWKYHSCPFEDGEMHHTEDKEEVINYNKKTRPTTTAVINNNNKNTISETTGVIGTNARNHPEEAPVQDRTSDDRLTTTEKKDPSDRGHYKKI
jgi:hypothetical protein